MKVIIAGSRGFNDLVLFYEKCDNILSNIKDEIEIVSGGAIGADTMGENYAMAKGYKIKKFLPDWNKHGKAAGHIRNREMGDYADALIAFWDGESKGTYGMIRYAEQQGLKVRVIRYKDS